MPVKPKLCDRRLLLFFVFLPAISSPTQLATLSLPGDISSSFLFSFRPKSATNTNDNKKNEATTFGNSSVTSVTTAAMPKPKFPPKRAPSSSDDDTSDSGPDDRTPKKGPSGSSAAAGSSSSGRPAAKRPKGNPAVDGQEPEWDLGKMKKVKVREFKGNTYIDIREYYIDKATMDTRPGKKGISLNCQQYQMLKSIIAEIDQCLP